MRYTTTKSASTSAVCCCLCPTWRVSVRPEEFVIVGADQPGIDATVEYSTFLGLNTHYVIRLKSGERVEIIQESQIDDIIENGTKIRLGVKAEKINVFNEDGTKSLIV